MLTRIQTHVPGRYHLALYGNAALYAGRPVLYTEQTYDSMMFIWKLYKRLNGVYI